MSVSEILKKDILDTKIDKNCCRRAFLSGVIRASGSLNIERGGLGLIIQNPSEELIDKCAEIIRALTKKTPSVFRKERSRSIGKKLVYELYLPGDESKKLLMEAGITSAPSKINDIIPPELIRGDCCRRAYIKGLFSATGNLSIADSGKKGAAGYYLEISLSSPGIAEEAAQILLSGGVEAKVRQKKDLYYIYIKDSEKISDFCAFLGANKGYFALQEVILSRLVSNTANRQFNCELANIDRTIGAATRQTEAILYIKEKAGLDILEEPLRVTAEARLNNPSASVKELGLLLPEPTTKSGVSHRMRKIIELADRIRGENTNA